MPKKKTKKIKEFKCPFCKEENTCVGQSERGITFYRLDVNTGDYETAGAENSGESVFFCLDCDKDISEDELEKQGISY